MVKVKICGITNEEDARYCSWAGADALGFIFWQKSPRYISPRLAKKIVKVLDPFISLVGVFVDESREKAYDIASYVGIDGVQFHGKESASYCDFFRKQFFVIKTFFPPLTVTPAVRTVDACLFDMRWEDKQRGVKRIPASSLKKIARFGESKIIISGGITVTSVAALVSSTRPYAVDVSSGVEMFPGKKDKVLVKKFIEKAKAVQYACRR